MISGGMTQGDYKKVIASVQIGEIAEDSIRDFGGCLLYCKCDFAEIIM